MIGRQIHTGYFDIILELGPKTLFDRDGNIVGHVEEKNKAFKQAVPAAVKGNRG